MNARAYQELVLAAKASIERRIADEKRARRASSLRVRAREYLLDWAAVAYVLTGWPSSVAARTILSDVPWALIRAIHWLRRP